MKHAEECIVFFETMANTYAAEAAKHLEQYNANVLDSLHFVEYRIAHARAEAYRSCAEALKNPMYFKRDVIQH